MTKSANKTKTNENRQAMAAAPVASIGASEAHTPENGESTNDQGDAKTDTNDSISPELTAGAEKRAAEISAVTTTKPAKAEKPTFVINTALRHELFGLTNAALLERARGLLKPVELSDNRVFQIDESNGLKDMLVGSDLNRSGIRSAVIEFLRSRDDNKAPGWAIMSYMKLAAGASGVGVYKGNFDIGYLAARGNDVRRGMLARKQLKLAGEEAAPASEQTTVETPVAEQPAAEPVAEQPAAE